MIATPTTLDIPIYIDEHGQIRIAKTRVLLELVINAFNRGESAEGIIESYSSLSLADVYAVIAYYLNHRTEIDAYIHQADKDFQDIQQDVEQGYSEEHRALLARMRAWRDNHVRGK
ncbi:MAG: DUF433 domain-containing protein [Anaerolineae bacterium]|jgi:uncharacterized protein (DUF433 family)|nr:DUF433 domain-containing protein [Anaerolineae bacterium]